MSTQIPLDAVIPADPELGAGIANYPSDRLRLLIIAGVIAGVTSVILNFTVATIEGWIGPALTIVIMSGLTLALGWYVLHLWNREIVLYERGFSYREGADVVFFRYEEVRGVRLRAERLAYFGGLLRRTVYQATLTTFRGEVIKADNLYRRAGDLCAKLADRTQQIAAEMLPSRLEAGEKVPFGEVLALSSAGVHQDSRMLAWSEIGEVVVAKRKLTLQTNSGTEWVSVPLREIENPQVLISALRKK